MKMMLLLSMVVYSQYIIAQLSVIRGIVSIHNSETNTGKRQYVSNAQVEDDFNKAQSTTTDVNGQFSLLYVGVSEKQSISFQIKKKPLEVVNISELHAVTGQTEMIKISMALPDSINEYRKRIYNIGKTQAEKRLEELIERKSTELNELRSINSGNTAKIRQLEKGLVEIKGERKKIEAYAQELARRYAPVNLDDASPFFKNAFLLFQQGKLDSALLILSNINLTNKVYEILEEREKLKRLKQDIIHRDSIEHDRTQNIAEALRFKADLHTTFFQFDSTVTCFELLLRLDSVNTDDLYQYAHFLAWQNQYDKAIRLYIKELAINRKRAKANFHLYEPDIARSQNDLGLLYKDKNEFIKAEMAFKEALDIQKRFALKDPQTFEPEVAATLNNLGNLYASINDHSKAETAYKEALKIRKRLVKIDPQNYEPEVARVLNNLGLLYKDINEYTKTEEAFREALAILQRFAANDPQKFDLYVAHLQNNLGILYYDKNQFTKAETAFNSTLDVYRRMAKNNPKTFEPDLALTLINLGDLYRDIGNIEKTEIAYQEALVILNRLTSINPMVFEPDLAGALINIGNFYEDTKRINKAKDVYTKALGIYKRLAKVTPLAFEPGLAESLSNLAGLHFEKYDLTTAENLYIEALKIRKRLVKINPKLFQYDLARLQNNLGNLYQTKDDLMKAEAAFNEALLIYEQLVKSSPKIYERDIAIIQQGLGNLYYQKNDLKKAENAYKTSLHIYKQLVAANATAYELKTADCWNNLAHLYIKAGKPDTAESYFNASLQVKAKWMKAYPEIYTPNWKKTIFDLIDLCEVIKDTITNNSFKIPWQEKMVELNSKLYQLNTNDSVYATALSNAYGDLCWYQLCAKQFDDAAESSQKALQIDNKQFWIKKNLAHALLLKGNYEDALSIYKALKSLKDEKERAYADICIEDLNELEQAGITHQDMIKIKEYFKN